MGVFIITVSLNELLHRSIQPEILFWSYKKFFVCIGLVGVSFLAFWCAIKLKVSGLPLWLQTHQAPYILFLSLTTFWFLANYSQPVDVGGDLKFQMIGFKQYLNGEVDQFNAQKVPIVEGDLAKDRIEHIIWYPPGPLYILYPLAQLGLPPELAARWMVFMGFLLGGCGFLALAKYLGFQHTVCLAFAIVLSLSAISRDGLGIISPTSADNLGFAIFPWLSLWTLRLLESLNSESKVHTYFHSFLSLGIASGALYIIKYSWFVAGASLAFFLGTSLFLFVRKLPLGKRLVLMGIYSFCFFIPFVWLNHHNRQVSGSDALGYNQKGSLGDNAFIEMVYGPNFSSTARPQELPFSLAAGPGFLLGGNMLATRFVHFLRQEKSFTHLFQEKLKTNAHIWALIIICLPFSILCILLLGNHVQATDLYGMIFLLTMVVLPLFLLGYLSLKSGFNYIVKDNYRYVIPYSLLSQLLLLSYYFCDNLKSGFRIPRFLSFIAIFWACIFPGAWTLQASLRNIGNESIVPLKVPSKELHDLGHVDQLSISFFLNGHGPRIAGMMPREKQISFILNGGLSGIKSFHTSKSIRVIVAVENNLNPQKPEIQEFLRQFPGVKWNTLDVAGTLYPKIYFGDMIPLG